MDAGRMAEAIPYFEQLLASGEAGAIDRSMAYDARLLNIFAYESLATCYFKLGHYAENSRYLDLALRYARDKLEYRVKRALASRLERRQSGVSPDGV